MEKEVCKDVLNLISATWANRIQVNEEMIDAWFMMLCNFPANLAFRAVKHIATQREFDPKRGSYPPDINELTSTMRKLDGAEKPKTPAMRLFESDNKRTAKRNDGLVLAKTRSQGRITTCWAKPKDCVRSPNGSYYRKIDFICKWALPELNEEMRRIFPNMDVLGTALAERGSEKLAYWDHIKDVCLTVAIDRAKEQTGKTVTRCDSLAG